MERRIHKAISVAVASTILSVLVTATIETLFYGSPTNLGTAIAIVIPPLIAFPVSLKLYANNDKLNTALNELKIMHDKARKMATMDLMTGILNRNSFLERFENRHRKTDDGALLMLDLDHFKGVNDTYGHIQGDAALMAVVACLKENTREDDVLGRMGGEEFAVFLSNVDSDQAGVLAERIREAIEKITFEPVAGKFHPLTISIGVAMVKGAEPVDRIIQIADSFMYVAKESGRNRVVSDPDPELHQIVV